MVAQASVDTPTPTSDQVLTKVVACTSPYGKGGLGRHFAEIVDEARAEQRLACYYSRYTHPNDPASLALPQQTAQWLPYTPFRYSPGWLNHLENELFDRTVARVLKPADEFEGFGGQTLHSFRRAKQLGYRHLSMQAANSHVNNVSVQHQKALAQWPLETSWLNSAQQRKTLKEYELADTIYVTSEYSRQTFLIAGVPASKLMRRTLKVNPRFAPPDQPSTDGIFRVVYVGSLTVAKGVPLLVEAFAQLEGAAAELTLVGGWATRGMRRYLQGWMAKDSRIRVAPGDPLPHLHRASVCVHPTYEDGFAYAPLEALACDVPVIVTADTGMKDYVREGINGYVAPTGDIDALLERLVACRKTPLKGGLL
jgi:glycosyltransferase involved in cell wall biosynthesis